MKIISRKSTLAKIQARLVADKINTKVDDFKFELITKETSGDIDLMTPLHQMPDAGVFTNDIREELLNLNADIAVHSWKDLPVEMLEGTEIFSTIEREDPRDLLFFKSSSIRKKNITIFTSSPRRKENLSNFLPFALPWTPEEIIFKDIRGNIQTRVRKFYNSDDDGLVIAFAALKRLIEASEFMDEEPDLLAIFKKFKWMLLPLSENPSAPAQGALAIEVASSNESVKNTLKKIKNEDVFETVNTERQILKKYGGGCHQKIGVTAINTSKGQMIYLKGETEQGLKLSETYFKPKLKYQNEIKEVSSYFPLEDSPSLYERIPFSEDKIKLSKLENSGIFISRGNALENINNISESNLIWTSGIETWKKIAKKGVWVNGSSDSLGEKENPPLDIFDKIKWYKLSHKDAEEDQLSLISTYELIPKEMPDNIEENSHFYWMSASSFKLVFDKFPSIESANHSCGMGKTFDEINQLIPGKVYPYQNYQDWLEKVKLAK